MLVSVPVDSLVPPLAQAGGGSAGFSGGGGGGGFSGGGGGGDGDDSGGAWIFVVLVVAVLVVVRLVRRFRARRREARRAARERDVRRRAVEAAEDDPALDPDEVQAAAAELFAAVQSAWDARDRPRLGVLLGPDLLEEWTRRLDDFDRKGWHSRAKVDAKPKVRLVGLVNREGIDDDRVVVFVACRMKVWVRTAEGQVMHRKGGDDPGLDLEQYWTLGPRDGSWLLLSIEEEAEGRHHLDSAVVATPADDPALARSSRVELAVADAPASAEVGTLVSTTFADDARTAALDLSLVDDRFSPDVLEVAVRELVEAWAEAVDGDDAGLGRRASEEAVQALLWGVDARRRVRTVVRGLAVDRVEIVDLTGDATPPTLEVRVRWRGAWYREDRDTQGVVEGSRDRAVRRTEAWTLALTDDGATPWRLVAVG